MEIILQFVFYIEKYILKSMSYIFEMFSRLTSHFTIHKIEPKSRITLSYKVEEREPGFFVDKRRQRCSILDENENKKKLDNHASLKKKLKISRRVYGIVHVDSIQNGDLLKSSNVHRKIYGIRDNSELFKSDIPLELKQKSNDETLAFKANLKKSKTKN